MSDKVVGTSVRVRWPFPENSSISLEELLKGLLEQIRKQYNDKNAYVHLIWSSCRHLDTRSFHYQGKSAYITYVGHIENGDANTIEIFFILPSRPTE